MHLLNLTIKSYSEAAKIGAAGGGGKQTGLGRAEVSKGDAKVPGPGIMSGEGEESSCSFSRGVYGSGGACVPVKSTHRSAQHMSPQITVSLPAPTPHSLLTEGRAERGAEKRRRFNRCLGAQCTFSRIHCLGWRRGQCGHFVSRRYAPASDAQGEAALGREGDLEIKTSGAPKVLHPLLPLFEDSLGRSSLVRPGGWHMAPSHLPKKKI